MLTSFIKKNISQIKYVYTFVYLVFFSLTYNALFDTAFNAVTSFIYVPLVFCGIIIMVADFFFSGLLLRFKYSWLLILFYFSCLITVFINFSYDLVGNIKMLLWMMIQTFVIATVNCEYKKEFHLKKFRLLIEVVAAIWFIGALISVAMFFAGYSDIIESDERGSGYLRIGFLQGRLFGIFDDPNYASMCVLFTALLVAANMFFHKGNRFMRIYHIVLFVVDYIYIVLAASRTTDICIYVISAVFGFFIIRHLISKRGIAGFKKIAYSLLASVLCVALSFGIYVAVDKSTSGIYILTSPLHMQYDENHNYEEDLIRPDVEFNSDISNNRMGIWKDYLALSKSQPIFGTGPRNGLAFIKEKMPDSMVAMKEYSFHNGYLALYVGSGIIGFVIMIGFVVMNVWRLIAYLVRKNGSNDEYYLPVVLLSAVLAAAAIGALPLMAIFFCNSAYDIIFWFVFGYVMSLLRIIEPERYKKEPTAYRLSRVFRIKSKH